jgi:hypothetical protein
MKCVFVRVKAVPCEDGGFGIEADLGGEISKYPSITRDRERIDAIVRLINSGDVSVLHIDEVIEDILG